MEGLDGEAPRRACVARALPKLLSRAARRQNLARDGCQRYCGQIGAVKPLSGGHNTWSRALPNRDAKPVVYNLMPDPLHGDAMPAGEQIRGWQFPEPG